VAYALSDTKVWDRELGGFFRSLVPNPGARTQLAATSPYRPGLIPVVFVHGTASSPGRWAEMYNRLVNSSRLRGLVQFWVFMYDTGAPIPYSAGLLRNALTEAVAELDPEGRDPALKRMVLIGHSQGGLLAKMNTISSGSRLWDGVSRKPLEELKLFSDTRERLRGMMFVEPLPFVERVIFLCTPHRGSFQARNLVADMFRRIVTLPAGVVRMSREVATGNPDAFRVSGSLGPTTSLDSMNPLRPFIRSLADIPVAPGVRAHSIIAVEGDGPHETGSDGVVTYRSAHIDGVESELVVRSGHSAQGQPEVIAEVMRILQIHAGVGVDTAAPVDAGPPLDVPRATR
jgi:Alpha/beta hydrolase family